MIRFMKTTLICALIGFLLWIAFGFWLIELWNTDKDDFWITLSVAGIIFLVFGFWMIVTANVSKIEIQGADDEVSR